MLIIQYILNLSPATAFKYTGSGTVVLSGVAPVVFNPVLQTFTEKFKVGEYVYGTNHTVWQIVAIQGNETDPVYVCQQNGQLKEFYGNQIVKFTNENQVFELIYQNNINAYENNIQYLDNIYNNLPSTIPETNNYLWLKQTINTDFGSNTVYDENITKYSNIINTLDELYNQA